jgi:ABC-type glycerol-3-phosphate transport system substrate-binding protein
MRMKAAILATLMLVTAACSGGPSGGGPAPQQSTEGDIDISGPVAITLWHALSGPQQKALDEAVAKFNTENGKGITVTALNQGNYTQLGQKVLAAINAGSLPDFVHAYESNIADYTKADVVVNLDSYVNSAKNGLSKESKDDIYQPYFDTNRFKQFNNQLLSFPFTKSMFVMYQNEDLLKAAGVSLPIKTWDDFEKAVVAATKKDASGKTTQYGWAVALDASNFSAWVYSRGGKLMSDDLKTVEWDKQQGLDTLRFIDKMIKGGYAYVPKGFDYQNDFGAGKLAFFMGSTSTRPFITAGVPAGSKLSWSISQIPQTDPAKAKTVMYGANVGILKSTAQKQLAAWIFIKWFSDTQQTASWATKSYYMPVRKSATNEQALKDYWAKTDPQGKQAFDIIGTSTPEPNVRGQQDIRDVIFEALTAVTTGKATPEEAIKTAGTKANQILKEQQ